MSELAFLHHCEVCTLERVLTPTEAFETRWDYPPRIGAFGVVAPRTCPDCGIQATLWWALQVGGELATLPREQWPEGYRDTQTHSGRWPPQ